VSIARGCALADISVHLLERDTIRDRISTGAGALEQIFQYFGAIDEKPVPQAALIANDPMSVAVATDQKRQGRR
jgi:hypothetical protein